MDERRRLSSGQERGLRCRASPHATTAPDGGTSYFAYDANGNRISEKNPLAKTTYYAYDEGDRLTSVTDPLGEAAYYEYDKAGNLTKSVSAAGRTGDFEYDAVNRRTVAHYDDGFAAYFAYDAVGNVQAAHEPTEGTVYFSHDLLNRMRSQVFAVGGAAYYAYDANDNRTELTYPSGGTAYYAYDAVDRMTRVEAPSGNATYYTYDASGNRVKSLWGNDTYTYYSYDKAERIASIRHFDDGGAALATFDYDRDGRANITHIARLDGLATYYGYDAADRLASEEWKDASGTLYAFSYDYDLNGNRTYHNRDGTEVYYTYDAADRLLHFDEGGQYTYFAYDTDGNLEVIEEPGGAVTYFEHASHGLVSKIKPLSGTEVTFGYDALLRRVRMTEGATTTYFRHDGINLLEIDDGATVTKLIHGFQVIDGIGSVVEVDVDGTLYYFEQDHRGTLRKVTDANGAVVWDAFCDAWGCVLSETGANPSIFFYQGQAWFKIVINGRTYYVSPTRLYTPELGRLAGRDTWARAHSRDNPATFESSALYRDFREVARPVAYGLPTPHVFSRQATSASLYCAFRNNPLGVVDPTGGWEVVFVWAVTAAGLATIAIVAAVAIVAYYVAKALIDWKVWEIQDEARRKHCRELNDQLRRWCGCQYKSAVDIVDAAIAAAEKTGRPRCLQTNPAARNYIIGFVKDCYGDRELGQRLAHVMSQTPGTFGTGPVGVPGSAPEGFVQFVNWALCELNASEGRPPPGTEGIEPGTAKYVVVRFLMTFRK
jgi:YD repeat-containing protein